jgi:hypothetical protein
MSTYIILAVVAIAVGPSFFGWATTAYATAKRQEEKDRLQRKNGPYRPR